MTKWERIIDKLSPGDDRAEMQKALTLFTRMMEAADLKDLVWVGQEAASLALVCNGIAERYDTNDLDALAENVDPKAKLPRRFDLWSKTMQRAWLKQHQKVRP